jgi:hypothetical protein
MNVIMSDSPKDLDVDPLNGVNQLSSLARIGLEMVGLPLSQTFLFLLIVF